MKRILLLCFYMLFIFINNFAQIPINGLIGKYSFSGNADNEMGANAHGVVNGAQLTTDRCNTPNSAYQFTLTSDHIKVSDFKFFIENEVSISLWSKADYLTSNCMLMLAPDNWNDRCVLCAQYVGSPSFIVWDYGNCAGNGRTIVNGLTFSDQWHHYVFMTSQTQNIKKVFMDGICISSQSYMGSLIDYNRDLYIGGGYDWAGGGIGFKGKIDDIRIYERALSQQEVDSLYLEDACANAIDLGSYNKKGKLNIYPNPANEFFRIKGVDKAIIQIFDLHARLIKTEIIKDEGDVVDIKILTPGVYTIYVINDLYTSVAKLYKIY